MFDVYVVILYDIVIPHFNPKISIIKIILMMFSWFSFKLSVTGKAY